MFFWWVWVLHYFFIVAMIYRYLFLGDYMARSKFRKFVLDPFLGWGVVQWCFAVPISIIMWIIFATCCTHVRNKHILKEYSKKPAVFIIWHGRTMIPSVVMGFYHMRPYAVTSRNKDGRLMAKIQHMFGAHAVYGSTSSGAVSVLRTGVRILRNKKRCIVMCPDGPSGPSLHLQDGAMYFAKMANAPIIPVCFTSSKSWFQNRWDRYLIALPFSKNIMDVGEPMYVKADIKSPEFEKERKKIENVCIKQMRDLDKIFNLRQVEAGLTAGEFKRQLREAKKLKKQARGK